MSSALWHFFWTESDWGGGSPPAPSPSPASQDPGSGGGGSKSREDYFPANSDYWDAREAYLRSLQQEMALELPPAAIEPAPKPRKSTRPPDKLQFGDWRALPRLQAERTNAHSRVESATNLVQLRAQGQRLRELHTAVQRAEAAKLAYERQLAVNKRNAKIARYKKALSSLMVLHALVRLIHPT